MSDRNRPVDKLIVEMGELIETYIPGVTPGDVIAALSYLIAHTAFLSQSNVPKDKLMSDASTLVGAAFDEHVSTMVDTYFGRESIQ